jgi:hypothetical protein
MARRVLLICTVVCVVLAGCTGSGGLGTDTPNTPTDGPSSEGNGNGGDECREVESRETPDFPTNVTRQTVIEYAEAHAHASLWNQLADGSQSVSIKSVFGFVLNQTESGYVIHVTTDHGYQLCEGVHGDNVDNRDYFINDSVIAMRQSSNRTYFTSADDHRSISAMDMLQNGTVIATKNTTD